MSPSSKWPSDSGSTHQLAYISLHTGQNLFIILEGQVAIIHVFNFIILLYNKLLFILDVVLYFFEEEVGSFFLFIFDSL